MSSFGDLQDYLETMGDLASGGWAEIDPQKLGDLQAFKDFADRAAASVKHRDLDF